MLNKDQIRKFKADAHALSPVVIIGQHELTVAVHKEIELALNAHELMKIRVNAADKAHRQKMIDEICAQHEATFIDSIGHILIIYRKKVEL